MRYIESQSPRLQSKISKIYFLDAPPIGHRNRCEVSPDGAIDLAFEITDCCVTPYLFGSATQLYNFETQINAQYFGVRFRPGVFPVFDQYCAVDLTDKYINLDYIEPLRSLGNIFYQDSSYNQKQARLENFLLSSVTFNDATFVNNLIDHFMEHDGVVNLARAFKMSGKSSRQIERQFNKSVGLSPMKLCRILRFQKAVSLIRKNLAFVDIALKCGFYDQSHMINEFKGLSGKVPSDYRS
jgi:AraC-like DNA-binding protein